jgi:hypothetical protein
MALHPGTLQGTCKGLLVGLIRLSTWTGRSLLPILYVLSVILYVSHILYFQVSK